MNKKLLAIAIASAVAAPGAYAIESSVSGHVNRAILFADDGNASDVGFVDNNNSQSRFRITGSGDLGVGGMKVGAHLEAGWASNGNSRFTIKGRNGNVSGGDSAFNIRHNYLWFSGAWGRINLGHTSQAYDGVADHSLSGATFLSMQTNGSTTGGSIRYKASGNANAGNLATGSATVGRSYVNYDGGRQDVLRYDTPKLGPFTARVSVGDNQDWSFRATLATKFSGAQVSVRGGYLDRENDIKDAGSTSFENAYGVTGTVLFSQGTNFTVAYSGGDHSSGNTEIGEGDTIYFKLGHRWGNNAIALDYGNHDFDGAAGVADFDTTKWGIGLVHTLRGPRVELYAGYENFDLDASGQNNVDDVDLFSMGARVRF